MAHDTPAIRAVDIRRSDGPEGRGVVLFDRLGISEPTFVPEGLLPIVGRCSGGATLAQIHRAAAGQYEHELSLADVEAVVQQLDERLLIQGGRFEAAVQRAADEFLAGDVRASSHAGSDGYPADADELRAALDAMLDGHVPDGSYGPVRGLVAPHIDLARGAEGYGRAYGRMAAAGPADLYVIFGTGHAGPGAPLTGLPLDWQTPLGRVATDRAFVDAVHARIGPPAAADLLIHRQEHSLEFQVLFLQHLHQRHFDGRPFRVAAFLCGAFPSANGDPLQEPWLRDALAAFEQAAQQADGGVCYLAGADLAHIGPFFGDTEPLDDARSERLADDEQQRLRHLLGGAPGRFHAAVDARGNPDRVCSAPAITMCARLAAGTGELLHYGQARAPDDSQLVSFCAMTFEW